MTQLTLPRFCVHEEHGEVEVKGTGHYPDTAMVFTQSGQLLEVPIADLISREDSNSALDILLSGIVPSRG